MSNPSPSGVESEVIPTTEPVEANAGGEVQSEEEKTYTNTDMQEIVKDRLAREQKLFQKQLSETLKAEKAKWTKTQQAAPNVEDTYKAQLEEAAQQTKSLMDQVQKYRDEALTGHIERSLNAQGCIDPALVARDLKTQGLVSLDDEGNIVVESAKSLDDLAKGYLSTKPYLKRAQSTGGLGTKPVANVSANSGDPSKPTLLEIEAQLGIKSEKRSALFGK